MSKVLFLLKRREDYNSILHQNVGLSTGLYNSAKFMDDMLTDCVIESNLVVCTDNNCIDREVTLYKPTHVIIEALWVTPTKFAVLQKLHPTVKWIVRLHSEMPFMSGEGIAMHWINSYLTYDNVFVACNAPRMLYDVSTIAEKKSNKLIYLPNYYPQDYIKKVINKKSEYVDVGCFGAIRPLKNHLSQAVAALEFAKRINKKLRFHVNAGRIEMNGGPAIHNLKSLFEHLYDDGHQLINHTWCPREDFLQICAQMDVGMQCNFSETFNIVGADLVSQGVPFVGSKEIPWSSNIFNADPTNTKDMADKLELAYNWPRLNNKVNKNLLTKYTNKTRKIWLNYFS
jgi:hypothetical protein